MDRLPRRKDIRLKKYDYSQVGYYFITICAKDKTKLFGDIVGADDPVCPQPVMKANEIGKIACECWNKINDIYDHVRTDLFCLMPNHIHGIIIISAGGQSRPPLLIIGWTSKGEGPAESIWTIFLNGLRVQGYAAEHGLYLEI